MAWSGRTLIGPTVAPAAVEFQDVVGRCHGVRNAERGVLVGIVVVVAFALRLGFVATAVVQHPLRADAGQYAQYAKNLCEHGVFSLATTSPPAPDSFRSPGYPTVLALCRWLSGDAGWQSVAIGLQVVLGTLAVLLAYRIARACTSFVPSLFAATLTALSPHLVVGTAYVLTECVTTFVVALAVWLVVAANGRWRIVVGALAMGAGVLCNEALVVVPFAFGLALWRRGRGRALAFVALALVPMVAWSVRNRVQPLAKSGSERVTASISHGSYPGMVFQDPRLVGFPYREDPEQPAFGASWDGIRRVLFARVAKEPWRHFVWYSVQKPVWLWSWPLVQGHDVYVYEVANSPYEAQFMMQGTHALLRLLHVPVMLLAAGTAVLALLRRRTSPWPLRALAGVAVICTLAYVPVIPDPRYLQPVRPLVFVLAAAGGAALVAQCVRLWRRNVETTPSAPA